MLPEHLKNLLLSHLETHHLADKQEIILEHAEPCVEITVVEEEDYVQTGNSRIAGNPDLPPGFEWPCDEEDRYYTFIAQFNLSELPPETLDFFPTRGMLYFFLGLDEPASDVAHKTFYYDGELSLLKKTLPPEGKEEIASDERNFVGQKINFQPSVTLPVESEVCEHLYEHHIDLYDNLCSQSDTLWGQHKSYGGDSRLNAYLCRNGLNRLMYRYYKSEQQIREEAQQAREKGYAEYAQELEEEVLPLLRDYHQHLSYHQQQTQDWHLLFTLSSLDEAGMCWWDAGYVEFFIHKKDLEARNFSNTYACIATS